MVEHWSEKPGVVSSILTLGKVVLKIAAALLGPPLFLKQLIPKSLAEFQFLMMRAHTVSAR